MSSSHAAPRRAIPPLFGLAVLAHGFRPFFLLAGVWAVAALALWVAYLAGANLPAGPLPMANWHAHEMIAGFIGAAMCGFLLTAIPNWTGRPGYAGWPLLGLVALYLAARLVLLPGSPASPTLAAIVALLPLPGLLLLVLPALVAARTPRLFGPPAVVLLFWSGDLLMLGGNAGWWPDSFATGRLLALDMALALVGLIGGRIVPAFTLNALRRAGTPRELTPRPWIDRASIAALLLNALVDLLAPGSQAAGAVAGLAAVCVLARLSGWHGRHTLGQPIVWVLHLAYLFIPIALATKAAFLLADAHWANGWVHLQSAGALATMILAVMTRAILGHTGRDLHAPPTVVAAYLLVPASALLRAFAPLLVDPTLAYTLAGLAWMSGFALYLAVYAPMLLAPRPDGKPG